MTTTAPPAHLTPVATLVVRGFRPAAVAALPNVQAVR
jgi:hypothetical protein